MRPESGTSKEGRQRILLITAEESDSASLRKLLEATGFGVEAGGTFAETRAESEACPAEAVVADLGEGEFERSVANLLVWLQRAPADLPVLVVHGSGAPGPALQSLRQAGAELWSRAGRVEELPGMLARFLERRRVTGGPEDGGLSPADLILGLSEAIRRVREQVGLVAPKDTSVLITGETGTGKERVARAIHHLSRRRRLPLVSVNCGGIPATLLEDEFFGHVKGAFTDAHQPRMGRFEQADRGTLFLDEIGDLPLVQPKLLRALQEREIHRIGGVDSFRVDVRVLAATNADLWGRVRDGAFREDLFYRINVFPIPLPPLRERGEDIPIFV